MSISTNPQTWLAALLTLAVYSYLYKENFFFRIAEHTMIPLAVAHVLTTTYHNTFIPYKDTYAVGQGWWWFWIFFALGILYYTRFLPAKYSWLTRYPISISVGWTLGSYYSVYPRQYGVQLVDAIRDLSKFENLLFFLMFATSMMYFFLTVGRKSKAFATAGQWGRWILMVGFGASFGNTVSGRISLFLGRLSFLLSDWLGVSL
jgi:hypothetical protein